MPNPTPFRRYAAFIVAVVALAPASLLAARDAAAQAHPPAAADAVLRVGGEVAHPLRLTAADLARLPRRSVRAKDHHGPEAAWTGVTLSEILRLAGVPQGEALRGQGLALYLRVEAADGYRAVFALPELDASFTDRVVLLADRRDGHPLTTAEGPLRIIVPSDKRPARWVRQVVSVDVLRAPASSPAAPASHPTGSRP
ncbi:MAG TPA: molybdopterin-dependent oxidoreductase [Longimicrobiaceae bacterium]|jgi:DMSO/TMAO reductase YedYZ molybdopterin-dependent catalytic subunit|nr:molybdopterin-dependent oxidoreductase [Longimicrobiaceae bacterium]